jgi:hypothetical protein
MPEEDTGIAGSDDHSGDDEKSVRSSWRERLERLLPFTEVLGLVGLSLYLVGRFANETLFGSYGVSVDEVGLNYTSLVWPLAVSALIYTAAIFLSSSVTHWLWAEEAIWRRILAIAIGGFLFVMLVRASRTAPGTGVTALWWCLWLGFVFGFYRRIFNRTPSAEVIRRRRIIPALLVISFILVPLFNSIIVPWMDYPKTTQEQIAKGKETAFRGSLIPAGEIYLVGVIPDEASNLPPDLPYCMHLFGASGGISVFYDRYKQVVWRIPSGKVVTRHPC